MGSRSLSITGRSILALVLTLGFYGLALSIVALLLFIPYAEVRFAERLHLRLALACLVGAFAILAAILPRRDRFKAPGPALKGTEHHRLFDEVSDVAQKTEQEMPVEVYLIPDVNAFVAERGGILGFGSHRVMGVGLPLLGTLTVPQFRAVLAHEFGHFYGRDTKLAPWVYKTRMAIIRTILSLGRDSWLRLPFQWYAKLFLRITNAVSRHQELVADELAARIAGPRALEEGLRTIHGIVPAYQAFWQNEFGPVLDAQYRPPLAEGFAHFTCAPSVAKAIHGVIEGGMESTERSPYDTHPTLQERVTALNRLPDEQDCPDDTLAISLLSDVTKLEQELLIHMFGEAKTGDLRPLEWYEVGQAVYVPIWEKAVAQYAGALEGVTPTSLPGYLRSPDRLAVGLRQTEKGAQLSKEEVNRAAVRLTSMALALALVHHGWALDTSPGETVSLSKDDVSIQPFVALPKLASSEIAADAWQQLCSETGIADWDLGESVSSRTWGQTEHNT